MAGIVRPARRPPGWHPPGPPPAGDGGRPELAPRDDEDLCLLSGDWRIFQKLRGHRWSLDDLVTAWIAARAREARGGTSATAPLRTLDLGCGLGSVLMMTAWRFPAARCLGVEAQPERAELARRSLAYNGAADRCRVITGDLRALDDHPEAAGPFDLITGTPPYFPRGTGTESAVSHVVPCRFELRGGVEEYLAAAAPRLAPAGLLVVCTAAMEEERVRAAAAAHRLRCLEHWDIIPRTGKPTLIAVDVLEAASAATALAAPSAPSLPAPSLPAPLPSRHTLVVRDSDKAWTAELRAVRTEMGLPPTSPSGA